MGWSPCGRRMQGYWKGVGWPRVHSTNIGWATLSFCMVLPWSPDNASMACLARLWSTDVNPLLYERRPGALNSMGESDAAPGQRAGSLMLTTPNYLCVVNASTDQSLSERVTHSTANWPAPTRSARRMGNRYFPNYKCVNACHHPCTEDGFCPWIESCPG